MECHGRRGRRGRSNRQCQPAPSVRFVARNCSPGQSRPSSCSGLYSFFIMSTLMAIIYLMLEYHCVTCTTKLNMNNMTKHIVEIAKNLSHIEQSYHDLEIQIAKFTHELPKLEGQVQILEALAHTLESKDAEWNPKTHLPLPNVDVYLTKLEHGRNISRLTRKHLPEMVPV